MASANERFKQAVKRDGTVRKAAALLDVSPAHLYMIFRCERGPSRKLARDIAAFYRISPEAWPVRDDAKGGTE